MKKIITIFLLALTFSACCAIPTVSSPVRLDSVSSTIKLIQPSDTVINAIHPNSKDSLLVVSIVNGVVHISSVFFPQTLPFVNQWGWLGAPVTALVLWIWRKRSIRRLKRLGRINDDDQFLKYL